MVLSNAKNTQINPSEFTAIKAASGFHTTEETKSFDADFEFLFTRSIEFRQETIYFLIVDRFNDGDVSNNVDQIQNFMIPLDKNGADIGGAIFRELLIN